jgi:hypothetical protein
MKEEFETALKEGRYFEFNNVISTTRNPNLESKLLTGERNVKITIDSLSGCDIAHLSKVGQTSWRVSVV